MFSKNLLVALVAVVFVGCGIVKEGEFDFPDHQCGEFSNEAVSSVTTCPGFGGPGIALGTCHTADAQPVIGCAMHRNSNPANDLVCVDACSAPVN